ncbi:MAG: class I SAM-dependent methyltransferase [Candidatus Saganbacteria bacterium]|nr:class I SAM-dependent methyltransferase [Candidatus Saganbacteria bacterium]
MGKEKYKIIKDPKHDYLRIDPIPTQQEVERYYKEEFYSSAYKQFNDSSLKVQKEEQEFFKSRWESICNICMNIYGGLEGLSLFDIGFGYAQALLYFREKGMKVSGLEPSPEGVEYAKSQGLDVFQSGIEDFSCVGSRRYDIVTLINVLEHLRDPADVLMNIKKQLLKPNGLLVLDVPNEFNDFQTAANEEYSLDEWWVCPPNHINYFSGNSLSKLLNDCGYEIKSKEASFPLEIFLLMGDIYVGNNELGGICHNKRVKFEYLMKKHGKGQKLTKFYQALADLDLGRQTVVYATPK